MTIKSRITLLIPLLITISLFTACTQEPALEPYFNIETLTTQCKSEEATPSEIITEGNSIILIQVFQTPDPCHEIKGNVTFEGNEITVNLKTEDTGQMCIQCIAEVIGKVTISNLSKGTYDLNIRTMERDERTRIEIE